MARRRFKTVRDLLAVMDADEAIEGLDLTPFSDLIDSDLAEVEARWPDWPVRLRRALLEEVGDIAEDDFRVNFDALSRLGLDDPDAEVRATAISNLWESEDADLIPLFIQLMQNDPEAPVRAEAAKGLGHFVYLGECDELLPARARRVEDALLAVLAGVDDLEVRRRALESVAYSGRPEIIPIIEAAYRAQDEAMRASAIFAMGRNLDERWAAPVLAELRSDRPEFRYEAARAAGELELADAVGALAELTHDDDLETQMAAIWSLGQIGGEQAQTALRRRWRTAAGDLRELIDDALANAELENLGPAIPGLEDEAGAKDN
ncbi:MAG: HEAT repeat domain-containing protein [Chloroflexi bacterium]|nr:HEAT repeat domain-containing protein [Chloroflexota bacterium]